MSDEEDKKIKELLADRGVSRKIYEVIEKAVDKCLDDQPDPISRAIAVSALAHLSAGIVSEAACCPFHALEVWASVGSNVITGADPGDELEWVDRLENNGDDLLDYSQGLPYAFKPGKLH